MAEIDEGRPQRMPVIRQQEALAQFRSFTEETAFDLGSALFGIARARRAPVVVNIRTSDRVLFHAAMPGTTPDNDNWVRRKSNAVLRFHQSSLLYGDSLAEKGRAIGPEWGIDLINFASHGGSFPIQVENVGVVAAITVSGLPQLDDHRLVIEGLGQFLKIDLPRF